jgi:AbrB family looped-hinge helix DNA binding protein
MRNGKVSAIDSVGRLVIPKSVREKAGLRPGVPLRFEVVDGRIEIEPEPRDVRIVKRGKISVAAAYTRSEALTAGAVRSTLESIRTRRSTAR